MLTASMGAGAIVGGLLSASRSDTTHARLMRSATLLGGTVLVVSVMPSIWWAMVALPFTGAVSVTYIALANSVLQVNADPAMRGRVMALYTMAFMGTAPFGSLIAGTFADRFGAPHTLFVGGLGCVIGAAIFAKALPRLRDYVRPIYREKGILPELQKGVAETLEATTPPNA